MTTYAIVSVGALLVGWALDLKFGDPERMPHPVVGFGRLIGWGERRLNKGSWRRLKGGTMSLGLTIIAYLATWIIMDLLGKLSPIIYFISGTYIVFTGLAGTTLVREVRDVFRALDKSLDEGRRQVARIVGRDTGNLSAEEVRRAALETLAENLSDGVVAPLFWFLLLGFPGIMAYKMVNTLDSMIGYRTSRFRRFGFIAAKTDDIANLIPSRLTAILIILSAAILSLADGKGIRNGRHPVRMARQTLANGSKHLSPNSGWPEAALASALDCRFGGPHTYFGEMVEKPYIGATERQTDYGDMRASIAISRLSEVVIVITVSLLRPMLFL